MTHFGILISNSGLKGSYGAISSFLSLWSATICLCIDKIPEVAKTKVSNQRDILYKFKTRSCPPKTAHSNTPHMSTSQCGEICKTPPKCIRKERGRDFYSRCSNVAAMSWRRCVSLWKRNYFVWPSKEDTTRNQWLSCIYNTVPEQFHPNIRVCAAHFTEECFLNLGE